MESRQLGTEDQDKDIELRTNDEEIGSDEGVWIGF
jgi:hypothetical protein